MSNLSGNYKISSGEVQGVDVVREQERRARLQLLDEIREPSPQPIFGEPVKVELEDETSRRIKNTLGDFTQVLINDSKALLGISRSSSTTSGLGGSQGGRVHPTSKRPPLANGMYKPTSTNIPKHPAPDKRLGYPRSKPYDLNICPPASLHNADSRLKDQTQWDNSHQRKPNTAPSLNGNSQNGVNNPTSISANPSFHYNLLNLPSNKTYPSQERNGMVTNTAVQASRYGESSNSAPPPKRSNIRPSQLKLQERKPGKTAESPIELETILREMKQAVPPPLTAIQTPRTDESGFALPDEPKEEVIFTKVKDPTKSPELMPLPPDPPKLRDSSRQSTPSPCISSSLQYDLEMSDSDDEAVTEVKSTPAEYPKSPLKTSSALSTTSSIAVNNSIMDVPQAVPSNSSSSESGDSDSDDSSSESNESDSSASSDASDADTPSKMWGLSNFFDETRRNHSPAFVPMDTSTNSSTAAVKEEPMVVPADARQSYSLVDDDSVNGILQEPIAEPIPNFLELDNPVNIKNEILSPITSPLHSCGPPAPPIIKGPRTPPSPSFTVKDEMLEVNKNSISSESVSAEASVIAELCVPHSQSGKHSDIQQNNCGTKEISKLQTVVAKKHRLNKNKSEACSPKTDLSPVTQSFDDEPSASTKGLSDVCSDKDENDVAVSILTSSCSVPSETSESSLENYSIKTRQKVSKSSTSKKTKSSVEGNASESTQNGNNLSKSVAAPKFKHPIRTCRVSNETKQPSKVVKNSSKSDQREVKTPVKSDLKDKSSSEKNKQPTKIAANTKGPPKTAVKMKKKPAKISPKQVSEGKKGEVKRKKSKFHIENFLQSPTISQSESSQLPKVSSIHSPSRDRSPVSCCKNSDSKRSSRSPSHASRSPSRSSSKSVERVKHNEKLRRSARCSERASSISQAESSVASNPESDTKKIIKRTPKLREHSGSPVLMEVPPLLLSPIPHNSPMRMTLSECAIPTKIMVCIPLEKLNRLPVAVHSFELGNKTESTSKLPQQPIDENISIQKKDSVLLEKSKNITNKHSISKDIKDKPRTDLNSKSNKTNKSSSVSKKEKSVKTFPTVSEPSLTAKSKTASSVNNKFSIKTVGKSSWDASENKILKKRKSEGDDKQQLKKKPKIYPDTSQERTKLGSYKTDSPNHQSESTIKPKSLERCDSVSSLSSLSSQLSQKSSKEKKNLASMSDGKRGKNFIPAKHIKQEKEEKFKPTIKKEPGTPDKNKEKSRDKLSSKDSECNQKPVIDNLWNDTSSQYCHWSDQLKEDAKVPLPIGSTLLDSIHRVCGFDWDNFGSELTKDLKETSNLNKHNNPPIMPMDYYYTEGRKQRHLAEKEKDPFLQTLKYFEATVLFILTSQQREECTKELESVYQFYRETLNFSKNVRGQQSSPGSTEFKLLILILRCQALLHVKLYNLKIKEIKEQQKSVSDFFLMHCPATVRSLSHPNPNSRLSLTSVPSPHSPTPSPASSVNSQTSGYSSSDVSGAHMRGSLPLLSQTVNVTQSMLEMICRQHSHLINLHMGHDLWEQADMYMTRSNLRDFFKEIADQSENLTLHSSIKDLVSYLQTGISLVKKCCR